MWTSAPVVDVLRERGELWEPRPGLVGLRGDALRLLHAIEERLARLADDEDCPEWRLPAGLTLETLARAGYFESFPRGSRPPDTSATTPTCWSPSPAHGTRRERRRGPCGRRRARSLQRCAITRTPASPEPRSRVSG